jgi:alkyl hydroperoxide reductase subunit AhpC
MPLLPQRAFSACGKYQKIGQFVSSIQLIFRVGIDRQNEKALDLRFRLPQKPRLAIKQGDIGMTLQIGDTAPDFEADTTDGRLRFHEWMNGSWTVLFSHPKDFTPVCTTELGQLARMEHEFEKRGVKIIELSVDTVADHRKWAADIKDSEGHMPGFPMIGDHDLKISKLWGMLRPTATGDASKRTANDNHTVRNVFVIGPDKLIKLIMVYPMATGRNFDEIIRVIDSLQLTAAHKVATPANWRQGDDVIIAASVTDDDARKAFPNGWRATKPYIRIVPQPGVHETPAERWHSGKRM